MTSDAVKGSYVLLAHLTEERTIAVGRLGEFYFRCGYYAYVGSAMGRLAARLKYHLKRQKKLYWHIDYLLQRADIIDVIPVPATESLECAIAAALRYHCEAVPGFGSTDCRCPGHLFFAAEKEPLRRMIRQAVAAALGGG